MHDVVQLGCEGYTHTGRFHGIKDVVKITVSARTFAIFVGSISNMTRTFIVPRSRTSSIMEDLSN